MHRLLQSQLAQHGGGMHVPPGWSAFIDAVSEAYAAADDARALAERAVELSSQELVDRNRELTLRNAELNAVREGALDCIISMSADGVITEFNPAAQRTFGLAREQAIGKSLAELLIPPRLRDRHREGLERFLRTGEATMIGSRTEIVARRADGAEFPAEMSVTAVNVSGRPSFTAYLRDVSEPKRREKMERARIEMLERIVQSRPLGETLKDLAELFESQCVGVRVAIYRVDGGRLLCLAAPRLPRSFIELSQGIPVEKTILLDAARHGRVVCCDNVEHDPRWNIRRSECRRNGIRAAFALSVLDADGQIRGAVAGYLAEPRDPTPAELKVLLEIAPLAGLAIEHQELTDRLAYQARHDPLTGLPNRMLLEDRVRQALLAAQRNGESVGVFFIDLDGFKLINDSLGHHNGDLLLTQLAKRLEGITRQSDTLARMGGDEFTLLAPNLRTRPEAIKVARRLLDAFVKPFSLDGRELCVSASIGIALYPHDGQDSASLQQNADAAMYRAKAAGRHTFEFYNPYMNAAAVERLELETQLRQALNSRELELHYQPQVNVSGQIVGLEALLRWKHPRLGLISPARFIPLAEESGMIIPIGAWVLHEALRQTRAWSERLGRRIRIAVNVSPVQFGQSAFLATLDEALQRTGIDPRDVELELTESLLMGNPADAAQKLARVREMGVGVAVDDFGTGYSSLAYLHRLPIDTLKIDRSFVQEVATTRSANGTRNRIAVIRAIASLAENLGLATVAEGVETEAQFRFLRRIGCRLMQGYLFSPAVPAEQVPDLFALPALPRTEMRQSA